MAMNSGNTDDNSHNPEVLFDMEGDPIGQKTSFWDILPILMIVIFFLIAMVAYFWVLQMSVTGG